MKNKLPIAADSCQNVNYGAEGRPPNTDGHGCGTGTGKENAAGADSRVENSFSCLVIFQFFGCEYRGGGQTSSVVGGKIF